MFEPSFFETLCPTVNFFCEYSKHLILPSSVWFYSTKSCRLGMAVALRYFSDDGFDEKHWWFPMQCISSYRDVIIMTLTTGRNSKRVCVCVLFTCALLFLALKIAATNERQLINKFHFLCLFKLLLLFFLSFVFSCCWHRWKDENWLAAVIVVVFFFTLLVFYSFALSDSCCCCRRVAADLWTTTINQQIWWW